MKTGLKKTSSNSVQNNWAELMMACKSKLGLSESTKHYFPKDTNPRAKSLTGQFLKENKKKMTYQVLSIVSQTTNRVMRHPFRKVP